MNVLIETIVGCLPFLSPRSRDWLTATLEDHANHFKSYEQRVKELEDAIPNLEEVKFQLELQVREQLKRPGNEINQDKVDQWINGVNEIISQSQKFLEDKPQDAFAVCNLFSSGYLPKPGIRYRRSRKALDLKTQADEKKNTKPKVVSYSRGSHSWDACLSDNDYQHFTSRDGTVEDITEALKKPGARMIGICGLNGVGKTALVKQLACYLKDQDKVFARVVIVEDVGSNSSIRKIQGEIIDQLGWKLEDESERGRAASMLEGFKRETENTLIILAHLSVKLELLKDLGIPYQNQGQQNLKVLLVSDNEELLSSQMHVEENRIFTVGVLEVNEAEEFFKTKAGIDDDTDSEIKKLAARIAKNCEGLPQKIVTTAEDLKHKSRPDWEDVDQRLERQRLQRVYDSLENNQLRETFLHCACMGRDVLVMDFVRHYIASHFLKGTNPVKQAKKKVSELVTKLKRSGLLSDSYSSDRFTMQDIVRDVALSIASTTEKPVFAKTKETLDQLPDEDNAVISLQHCDIIGGLREGIKWTKLEVFRLDTNDPRLEIPKLFFKEMKKLKVLVLTGVDLSPLPRSITNLAELTMLSLEECMLGEGLSFVGELKTLRILSLSRSDIKKLPAEFKNLAWLQILDISDCYKLREIPSHVISSLTRLEELYMRNSLIQWKVEGPSSGSESENASLLELNNLKLKTLVIEIPNHAYLPKHLSFGDTELDIYKIVIGDSYAYLEREFKMPEKYEASRSLSLELKDGSIGSQIGIKTLLERVEILLLGEIKKVDCVFGELNPRGFLHLKHLSIVYNFSFKCVINWPLPEKAFSELESMYLYKLHNIEQICNARIQPIQSHVQLHSFRKLKTIKIKMCGRLKNVFLSSMVGFLAALETIEVSQCNSLKNIVAKELRSNINEIEFPGLRSLTLQSLSEFIGFYPIGPSTEDDEQVPNGVLFNEQVKVLKLEIMKLSSIKIQNLWSDQPLPNGYFRNLVHLEVNDCRNLTSLLPFSVAKSLENLQSLVVSECENVASIFLLGPSTDTEIMQDSIFPELRSIKLNSMKSLTEIWNTRVPLNSFHKLETLIIENCNHLVNVFPCYLENLQEIRIDHCVSLKNIFPVAIAICLKNLKHLVVWNCRNLRDIVAKDDTSTDLSSPTQFEFPKLTKVSFSRLPKLESFYSGAYDLSCPALKELAVDRCAHLRPFRKETADAPTEPCLFSEKVLYMLKFAQIDQQDAESLRSLKSRMDNLEELHLSGLSETEIVYFTLQNKPNLKTLWLNDCSFEELVPLPLKSHRGIENLRVVPQLKSLKLIDLCRLEEIGFEPDSDLQTIESLILKDCPKLVTISVSFIHLTSLEVVNCKTLRDLMTVSTARSLVQLTTMKVIQCERVRYIVSDEGNEEEVVFRQLKALELDSLESLTSFCDSKSCVLEFPSLEKLVVSCCPRMQKFCDKIKRPPLLRNIDVADQKEDVRSYWKGDVNETIGKLHEQKDFLEALDVLKLSDHWDYLEDVWVNKISPKNNWFNSLKSMSLVRCRMQPYAIPSSVLPCLMSLKELMVRKCESVESIFDTSETETEGTAFQLETLELESLPKLMDVWDKSHLGRCLKNKPKKNHVIFQNLRRISVSLCADLVVLFPASVAENLKNLKELDIRNCGFLERIVELKEEDVRVATVEFPRLTSLVLSNLPRLTYFYPNCFILKCPELNRFTVVDCDKFELFHRDKSVRAETQKVLYKLAELTVNQKIIEALMFEQFPEMQQLAYFCICIKEKGTSESTLPYGIFKKAPNLEIIEIRGNSYHNNEILPSQTGENRMLGHLKELKLFGFDQYMLIGSGSESESGLDRICENGKLIARSCYCLETLVHCQHSFSRLRELDMYRCTGLANLFTSSTAKKLVHLAVIKIEKCDSMKEIMEKEEDGATPGEIQFVQLEMIHLLCLSRLRCFYSGNATLHLPSLKKVTIEECPEMKFFSKESTHAESLEIQLKLHAADDDELVFRDDLNTSVIRLYQRQFFLKVGDDLRLSDHWDYLKDIWLNQVSPKDNGFNSLKTMSLVSCTMEPYAIPSNVLPCLRSLEGLTVQDCNNVEAIFDTSQTEEKTPFQLKTLVLERLPKLMDVWDKNPHGSFLKKNYDMFQNLQWISVSFCKDLVTVFPASLAKNLKKLKEFDINNCSSLQKIVQLQEEEDEEVMICLFHCLTSLVLSNLPLLTDFYPNRFILKCPELNRFTVMDCDKFKLFYTREKARADTPSQELLYNVAELTLNQKIIKELRIEQFPEMERLTHFSIWNNEKKADNDKYESSLPYGILEKAHKLQKLEIHSYGGIKEIFIFQFGDNGMLGCLRELELYDLDKLQFMGLGNSSFLNRICENLHKLRISSCPGLTALVPYQVCNFSNLKELVINRCHGLKDLFTSSTAKTLGHLKVLKIHSCDSMTKIVAQEEDPSNCGEINFERLEMISLKNLSRLECFHSGEATLQLPSGIQVVIQHCPKMKIFSHGSIHADSSLVRVNLHTYDGDELVFQNDINASVRRLFQWQTTKNRIKGKAIQEPIKSLLLLRYAKGSQANKE